MSVTIDDAVPAGVLRHRVSAGESAPPDEASTTRGRLARTLAASKPGGLLLCLDSPELSFWLLDGMDITSKLICLASDEYAAQTLSRCHDEDIRLTVHCQHAIEFLGDVRDHRFDLMVCSELDPGLAELAVGCLSPGGILAVAPAADCGLSDGAGSETALARNDRLLIGAGAGGVMIAVKSPDDRSPKRRGGRKRRPAAGL